MIGGTKSRDLGLVFALAAVYACVARLGLTLDALDGFVTLVWPPSGVALAALLLLGNRVWPGVLLGAWCVNVWVGAPIHVALGIGLGNTLEALLGAYAMRRFGGFDGSFDRLRHVTALILPAAALSTVVSATVGVLCLRAGGLLIAEHMLGTWRAWWLGDALGDLVVAPVVLAWATGGRPRLSPLRWLEATALVAATAAVSVAVFFRHEAMITDLLAAPHVLFPLFVWAAVRFGLRGAASTTALVSLLAVWGTARGLGPFSRETLSTSLLGLQTFMGCSALTPLVVAGAIADRAHAIRSRDELAAVVSHDLKDPLNVIGLSATLLEEGTGSLEGRAHKHVQLVQSSIGRMKRLVGDLLDAAAIEAGHIRVVLHAEDGSALVNDAVATALPVASSNGQLLRAETTGDCQIMCDRQRVLQVLSNL